MNSSVKLSIIIVSYNTAELLSNCLHSLVETDDHHTEIIVVDNGSQDSSVEMIQRNYPQIKLLQNEENLGFAAANNQAVIYCKGDYIMLLNSDTVMLEGTVEKIMAFMDANEAIGIVGCKLLNTDGSLQPSTTSYPHWLKDTIGIALKGSFLKNTPFARKFISTICHLFRLNASRFDAHDVPKEIGFPRGACFTIRKKVIDLIGFLDESYFFTGEEMDFAYRAKLQGWKVYYYPDAAIIHHDHGASKNMMGKVFVQTRKSALLFYQKHYSRSHKVLMKISVSGVLLLQSAMLFVLSMLCWGRRKHCFARIESNWYIVRLHFDKTFRKQNVFSQMKFKYQ